MNMLEVFYLEANLFRVHHCCHHNHAHNEVTGALWCNGAFWAALEAGLKAALEAGASQTRSNQSHSD